MRVFRVKMEARYAYCTVWCRRGGTHGTLHIRWTQPKIPILIYTVGPVFGVISKLQRSSQLGGDGDAVISSPAPPAAPPPRGAVSLPVRGRRESRSPHSGEIFSTSTTMCFSCMSTSSCVLRESFITTTTRLVGRFSL